MSRTDLEVVEGNDPTVEFTLYERTSNGVRTPTDLTNAVVECYVKGDLAVTDSAAIKYIATVTDAPAGRVRVDMLSADVGGTNVQFYHLDVMRNGRRQTYAYGTLKKVNV